MQRISISGLTFDSAHSICCKMQHYCTLNIHQWCRQCINLKANPQPYSTLKAKAMPWTFEAKTKYKAMGPEVKASKHTTSSSESVMG